MKSRLASCFAVPSEAKYASKEIERQLKVAKKESRKQVKLLVLGTAESGKSTFIKQMRIIHGQGYSLEEKKQYICVIFQNINASVKILINAMERLEIEYDSVQNQQMASLLHDHDRDNEFRLTAEKARLISKLWEDGGIQKCYLRRNEFHLFDSAAYYLNSINRIASPGYVPNLQDILRTRAPTYGIVEYLFNVERFVFGIVDVGGQKSERRKWIHCFESVTSIIFLSALSEYDQTIPMEEINQDLRNTLRNGVVSDYAQNNNHKKYSLPEVDLYQKKNNKKKNQHHFAKSAREAHHMQKWKSMNPANGMKSLHGLPPFPSSIEPYNSPVSPQHRKKSGLRDSDIDTDIPPVNRLEESGALFKVIVENPLFLETSFILFLNKTDILEEKIMYSPLKAHFSSFTGPEKDSPAACDFILTLYLDCFERMKNRSRSLYHHFTCATDTDNIRFVFAAVKDMILQSYLVKYNLV